MAIAITRGVSPALGRCELTHVERRPIDPARARAQHESYCRLLEELGWSVVRLPADPDLPDCVFVEDTAVVLDDVAVRCRPGVESRRGEVDAVMAVIREHREVVSVEPPGTLDGGDVVHDGRRVWIGCGARTNESGFAQVRAALEPRGYRVSAVSFSGCLHLKSAATLACPEHVVVSPRSVDPRVFDGCEIIEADPSEPFAANVLRLDDLTIVAAAFPRTRERLERREIACRAIDASELAKAEGGLTCCCVLMS